MDHDLYKNYLNAVVVLVFLLGALIVVLWLLRRAGLVATTSTPRGRARRLAVIETLMLDPRHKLLLVRRDNTEHLIALSPEGETVIETGITASDLPMLSVNE